MDPLVRVNVELKVFTYAGEFGYLARCPYLNAVSSGESAEVALAHLEEELRFLIEICADDGTMLAVLQHRLSVSDLEWPRSLGSETPHDLQEHWIVLSLPAQGVSQLTDAALHEPESTRLR